MIDIKKTIENHNGTAFRHLERDFWVRVLTEVLEQTGGNALDAARILGISRATVANRAHMYDIDIDKYREDDFYKRKRRLEDIAHWKYLIKRAFVTDKTTVDHAARNLGWPVSTMYERMKIVGYKR